MIFLRKFFPTGFLLTSILFILYIYYKSEIYWNGAIRANYIFYYAVSGISIIFSIIIFFLNKEIKDIIIISSISIITSLYLFESYLILNLSTNDKELEKKIKIYKKETGKEYDLRTPFEIYTDLKKTDKDIIVTISPSYNLRKNNKIVPLTGKKT